MPDYWATSEERATQLLAMILQAAAAAQPTHLKVAATMDRLADTGAPKHAARRHELADRARSYADMEARHIAELERRRLAAGTDSRPVASAAKGRPGSRSDR